MEQVQWVTINTDLEMQKSKDDIEIKNFAREQKATLIEMDDLLTEFQNWYGRTRSLGLKVTADLDPMDGKVRAVSLHKTSVNIPSQVFVRAIKVSQ